MMTEAFDTFSPRRYINPIH